LTPIPRTVLVLLCCLVAPIAEAATPDEIRLLGSDRDEAQYQSLLPFTRTTAASGVVQGSLAQAADEGGVPPAAMLEALDALGSALDLKRDLHDGDHFYIRYERTFTAEGNPVGTGRVLWAELRTAAKGTVAIHRFRPLKAATDSFWLSTGQSATVSPIKLPLDTITVSSGFGMRADPFDQPFRGGGQPLVQGGGQQWRGKVTATPAGSSRAAKMAAARALGGSPPPASSPFTNPMIATVNTPTALGLEMGLAAPGSVYKGFGGGFSGGVGGRGTPTMFMHEGVDLAADVGTPIHAAGDGVVKGAQLNGGYGNWIEIDHDGVEVTPLFGKPVALSTVYGHLSAFAPGIAPGVRVKQGDVIGFVGSTGRSTGPHLHFEILQNGHPTNPMISPTLRTEQLKGGDLERFKKAVAKDLSQRLAEAGSI
jgi:murein DD-endopeptidase MepM/ murein hydrolase activator NlpD